MKSMRPFSEAQQRLKTAGLRLTKQRVALGRLLLEGPDRHVTAESFHEEAISSGIRVSLATIYNSLHQFTEAGLLRKVIVDGAKTYFDTNTSDHHHFYLECNGDLIDIPEGSIEVTGLPTTPDGTSIDRVDVVVRLCKEPKPDSETS